MTVCVAAMAAREKAIVVIADKALSYVSDYEGVPSIWAGTDVEKIFAIGPWRALVAGDISFAERVVGMMNAKRADDSTIVDSLEVMTACARDAFQAIREAVIDDTILRPRLLSRELLFNRPSSLSPLDKRLCTEVQTLISSYRPSARLLLCGFSQEARKLTPHLFSVGNEGVQLHDAVGFHAIGEGYSIAVGRLLSREFDRTWSLDTAIYHAFEAKAEAEIAQGVSLDWDGEVIIGRHNKKIPDRINGYIGGLFDDMAISPYSKTKHARPSRIAKWRSVIKTFTQHELRVGVAARSVPKKAKVARSGAS